MQNVSPALILCCKCGASMHSNPTNICEACLAAECDITADIEKNLTVTFCQKCSRFLNPPSQWVPAALESPELLSLCLKKVKGLGKGIKLKEASFVFSEPHSRRLIIQVVVRGELFANTIVEQKAIIHFVMHPQLCPDCTKQAAKDYWNACVQIRQKVDHKRTLHYLEQVLLKKNVPKVYSNVKQAKGGMDFFFSTRAKAMQFVEYISKLIPCRTQTSQQLKSHDVHNNTFNYKFTFCLEVVPVCKNDIVCLPKNLASRLGFSNQLLIASKITDKIRLLDSITCQARNVDVSSYFTTPFSAISNQRNCTEFFVMDVEEVDTHYQKSVANSDTASVCSSATVSNYSVDASSRLKPIGAWVVPISHLSSDTEDGESVFVRSHLGHILKVGDSVLGLDLRNSNINNAEYEAIPVDKRPDVILIQRLHATSASPKPAKRRRNLTSSSSSSKPPLPETSDTSDDDDLQEYFDAVSSDTETDDTMQIDS